MRYVVSGYTVVLAILFLYGLQLLWRRRRLNRLVADVERSAAGDRPDPGAE